MSPSTPAVKIFLVRVGDKEPRRGTEIPRWSLGMTIFARGPAWRGLFYETLPMVATPRDVDRVLRAFEHGWQALDKSEIASLFTEDGMLQWADDWARGRRAIRIALLGKAGALRLRAQMFETHDSLGVVAGAYGFYRDSTWVDQGRYVFSLRKARGAEWQIAVAFLSNTTPAVPPIRDPFAAEHLIAQLDSAGVRRAAVLSLAYQFGAPYRTTTDERAKVRAENDWVGRQVVVIPEGSWDSAASIRSRPTRSRSSTGVAVFQTSRGSSCISRTPTSIFAIANTSSGCAQSFAWRTRNDSRSSSICARWTRRMGSAMQKCFCATCSPRRLRTLPQREEHDDAVQIGTWFLIAPRLDGKTNVRRGPGSHRRHGACVSAC